ncbi:MAG: FkbM family methyltransferase [Leptolyngbya sp. SIOISBB]|nr:FkbM family methyltransferase [Leptolyngbya sp. SIOISBB]
MLKTVIFSFLDLPGFILERRVNYHQTPFIFHDWKGYKYWQYPGDNIKLNCRRRAVLDSKGVVNYIKKVVEPGWECIDIGAAIGAVSVPLWSQVGQKGIVFSVEADPHKIEKLSSNLKLNGFKTEFILNIAISDESSIRGLRCYPENSGWDTFGDPSFAKDYESFMIDIETINVSDLARKYTLNTIDLVKIDVEGAEVLVLNGMKPLLDSGRVSQVIFEVNYLMLEGMGATVTDLLSFWEDMDYSLWEITKNGTLASLDIEKLHHNVCDCVAVL